MAAAKFIKPSPGLPKTIGVFNLIFGGLMLLCGFGCLNLTVPSLIKYPDYRLDPKMADQVAREMKQSLVEELKKREDSASTDAEKTALKNERKEWEAKSDKITDEIDINRVNKALRGLWLYLWVEIVSAPVLNFLMLVSGIGLILLKNWARVLAVGVAVLKIVRLVALCVVAIVFVAPPLTQIGNDLARNELGKAIINKAQEEQRKQGNGGPGAQLTPELIAQVLKAYSLALPLLMTSVGSVYPVIVWVVLTRPGAKAACLRHTEDEWEQQAPRPEPLA